MANSYNSDGSCIYKTDNRNIICLMSTKITMRPRTKQSNENVDGDVI